MDINPNNHEELHQTRTIRIARFVHAVFQSARDELRAAREQLATADLNFGEGKLRSSVAPAEYLPKPPDYPPIHDDTIIPE